MSDNITRIAAKALRVGDRIIKDADDLNGRKVTKIEMRDRVYMVSATETDDVSDVPFPTLRGYLEYQPVLIVSREEATNGKG